MWAGSLRNRAREPSRIIVKNLTEYKNFISMYNGKMNVFTSVYDYEHFSNNRGLEYSIILDRIFLDFDAHGKEEELGDLYEHMLVLHRWLLEKKYKHTVSFSGRGFHMFVYGVQARSLREIKAFFNICHDVIDKSPYLDTVVINTGRLRRVQNTYHLGANRWCIPLTDKTISSGIRNILDLSKNGPVKEKPTVFGHRLVSWPSVKKMENMEVEIHSVESPGDLPILPCLKNAIMVENPNHRARVLLVQWYNEFLSEYAIMKNELKCTPRQLSGDALIDIKAIINNEIKLIASNEDIWIDYNQYTTQEQVSFIVDKRYMSPHCETLIEEGLCVGKCWRYGE